MVHIIFDPNTVSLGDSIQFGDGFSYFYGMSPFQRGWGTLSGIPRQRGAGVGAIFQSLWRMLKPMAKRAGKSIGKEGLATGGRILSSLAQGGDFRNTVANETKTGVNNLISKVSKKQKGDGLKRKRLTKQAIVDLNKFAGKSVVKYSPPKKKLRSDAFGLY